ncbi:hypothetical protein [Pelagicoccus mobilis]|uniref:Uncharacterized protein n=2 Tax=Pelagicoccus mobilis TaxID=415221 RepID=A0A934RWZ5_9BACT|nr:hypothetical protein [Pelagicoccus mobilis]MBK1876749.1 hypothetical protein [Pelagicoccus mobilis]
MIPVLVLHEWAMPSGLETRVDLLAIITILGPVFAAYCFRLCVFGEGDAGRHRVAIRLEDLSWSERTSLLPFNHEPPRARVARLRR